MPYKYSKDKMLYCGVSCIILIVLIMLVLYYFQAEITHNFFKNPAYCIQYTEFNNDFNF